VVQNRRTITGENQAMNGTAVPGDTREGERFHGERLEPHEAVQAAHLPEGLPRPGVTLSQPGECRIDRFPVHSAALDLVACGRGREVIGDLLTNHAAELPGYIGAFKLHLETPAYIEATQARPRR
jgi:hypothetical protein